MLGFPFYTLMVIAPGHWPEISQKEMLAITHSYTSKLSFQMRVQKTALAKWNLTVSKPFPSLNWIATRLFTSSFCRSVLWNITGARTAKAPPTTKQGLFVHAHNTPEHDPLGTAVLTCQLLAYIDIILYLSPYVIIYLLHVTVEENALNMFSVTINPSLKYFYI